jgi:energy-coupling factor transporter ATP-binding protein EcfA2
MSDRDAEKTEETLSEAIATLATELERLNPNMRALDRLTETETRLKTIERDFEASRRAAKRAKDAFDEVKDQRFELFNKAFAHISDQIGSVYKDLTRSANFPLGGQAYLDIEDSDEPYLMGVRYHAMPPLKRFRDMEHLSGGEKSIAALALLFAVHSHQPSPFFVLDEVDAALDNANVAKVANYVKMHARPGMQFIVISLKMGMFVESQTLVGVMRDQGANSSRALTLDVSLFFSSLPFPRLLLFLPSSLCEAGVENSGADLFCYSCGSINKVDTAALFRPRYRLSTVLPTAVTRQYATGNGLGSRRSRQLYRSHLLLLVFSCNTCSNVSMNHCCLVAARRLSS